jgi:IS4 transposase
MVAYIDPASKKELVFVTNLLGVKSLTISLLYKNRWVIEPLFKQIKQNFELTYFLADSQEGIKTQLWIAMILNLLFLPNPLNTWTDFCKLSLVNLQNYEQTSKELVSPGKARDCRILQTT